MFQLSFAAFADGSNVILVRAGDWKLKVAF